MTRAFGGVIAGVLGAAILSGGAGCSTNISDTDISEVAISRVSEYQRSSLKHADDVLLIDTRSEEAFAQGHIPGARNLRLGDLQDERTLESLYDYDTIVVYGRDPGDYASKAVAKTLLAEKKINRVVQYPGGFSEWKAAGQGVETGP